MQAHDLATYYQVLWLQLVGGGRKEALCGPRADNARTAPLPFLVGAEFPGVYFEMPLAGDPFLDVTLLYSQIEAGTRIDDPAAAGTGALMDFFAGTHRDYPEVNFGFELDTSEDELPAAAVHFQPGIHRELAAPFCEAAGEAARAELYLKQADRMPEGWDLAFFGMFRGRPQSPLRVCGYLDPEEQRACASDSARLDTALQQMGFRAYDDEMLRQMSQILALAPGACDFQIDVHPDGTLGDTLGIDVQFELEAPGATRASFEDGPIARVMEQLEAWGIADSRWKLVSDTAFARALPLRRDGGLVSFTLLPQWAKVRWRDGLLQPAKIYLLGKADPFERRKA